MIFDILIYTYIYACIHNLSVLENGVLYKIPIKWKIKIPESDNCQKYRHIGQEYKYVTVGCLHHSMPTSRGKCMK